LPVSGLTAGLGFILHELGHRYFARRAGCVAYYRMWKWGLILALATSILSAGRFIFAAPGAVYIACLYRDLTKEEEAYISAAGPAANMTLALLFRFLHLGIVSRIGFQVNSYLALFNLLPFPPLDGWKLLRSNVILWVILTGLAAFMTFLA
ncbi:zinc metalloprotease, partial [Thermococcus sp.]